MTESTLRVDADFEAIRAIGPWLREILEPLGAPSADAAGSIELAVHELATNSIDHAQSAEIVLEAAVVGIFLDVVLSDDGLPFVGRDSPEPNPTEPQVRGYGLMIVEALAKTIDYERSAERNQWRVRFDLGSA